MLLLSFLISMNMKAHASDLTAGNSDVKSMCLDALATNVAEQRKPFLDAILWGNTHFPMLNTVIVMKAANELILHPISLKSLRALAEDEEVDRLMSVASRSHGAYQINPGRLNREKFVGLYERERRAVEGSLRALKTASMPWIHRVVPFDFFYLQRALPQQQKLKRLAETINEYFATEEFKNLSREYREAIREQSQRIFISPFGGSAIDGAKREYGRRLDDQMLQFVSNHQPDLTDLLAVYRASTNAPRPD